MATNTYVAIDQRTLGSNQGAITFTNIPQTYTDLRLVIRGGFVDSGFTLGARVGNGSVDTGGNYGYQLFRSSGSSTNSYTKSNMVFGALMQQGGNNLNNVVVADFMNYSSTTTFKNWLCRYGNGNEGTDCTISTWRSTAAINTISIAECGDGGTGAFNYGNMLSGTTISLYGIAKEGIAPAAKAIGGTIYSDDTYYYHVFGTTALFTPSQALSADIMTIAGGGGGGCEGAGGGGAGGFRVLTSQSLSSGVAYTCTVGAGGAGSGSNSFRGFKGTNTTFSGSGFSTISSTGGGGGGSQSVSIYSGQAGGSGGGARSNVNAAGGAGNEGGYSPVEGYAGATTTGSSTVGAGGGGGAGGVGTLGDGTTTKAGAGGPGNSSYSSWATATGTGINGVYAGGGGGGVNESANSLQIGLGSAGGGNGSGPTFASTAARVNTGSGGGGGGGFSGYLDGAAGGSGLIIVRYTKA